MSKAANSNYADAQFDLSRMYDDGVGVTSDAAMAAKWMSAAALNGDLTATYLLALRFDEGDGVVKSGRSAAKYIVEFLESDHEKRVEWVLGDAWALSPETVYHLQDILAERGLYRGSPDGIFGPGTVMAVKTFIGN